MLRSFAGKHVLLLQGPMGPFFLRLRKDLEAAGARVSKINFCAGDLLFYPTGATSYRGGLDQWPEFIGNVVLRNRVDAIFLFGDCRPHHYAVRDVAHWMRIDLFVFEEGYLRPDYITIEHGGVNNHSAIPRRPEPFLDHDPVSLTANPPPYPVKNAFSRAAVYAMAYGIANALFAWRYPHYRHHRSLHPIYQTALWLRGWFRKYWFRAKESKYMKALTNEWSGGYFLVPLQVHNDAQVTTHSPFASVDQFITEVVKSFAAHAKPDDAIVFKHHPMDRAYCDYTKLIARLAREHGLEGRLLYVHDLHLPTLLRQARGTVVINSTVGLSSVHHGTPVITLGNAVYDMRGLTFQGTLEQFWRDPGSVDDHLYRRFRHWLLAHNQANGNFYRRLGQASNRTGVIWPLLGGVSARPAIKHAPAPEEQVESPSALRSDAA